MSSFLSVSLVAAAQQVPDSSFDASVARPTFTTTHPRVAIDAAHHNFHTAEGRYAPFARLLTSDGFTVSSSRSELSVSALAAIDVLVVANALGADEPEAAEAWRPAVSEVECRALATWVRAGGALLLIADHEPAASAAESVGLTFGVVMGKGITHDRQRGHHYPATDNGSDILFSAENGLLGNHPTIAGRNESERVRRIVAFTGQSLSVPAGATALLRLSNSAIDRFVSRPIGKPRGSSPAREVSAAGRAMAVGLNFGQGRVVVTGEAAMLTAQLFGDEKTPIGMNRRDLDNRQFALNVLHWLTRIL